MKAYREANPRDRSAYKAEYDAKNADRIKAWWAANRDRHQRAVYERRLARYGVPAADWDRLLAQTVCDCCGEVPSKGHGRVRRKLYIDHDHATGKFRGMLCCLCNPMVGFARDSAARLQAGIVYLAGQPTLTIEHQLGPA